MNYPTYVMINGRRYNINTDFRVAIECNQIGEDKTIGNFERALAIVYKLFGEDALNNNEDFNELLNAAKKFLSMNKEIEETESKDQPDMDYIEDYDYIEASFQSDYNIDLSSVKMHWWKFFKLLCGLSNSEMGNCCILNRIRNLRNLDLRTIQDPKEREKLRKAQEQVALKKYSKKFNLTKEQEDSIRRIDEIINKKR